MTAREEGGQPTRARSTTPALESQSASRSQWAADLALRLVGVALLCVVALIAYLRRVLHGGFLSDDWIQVSTWHAHRSWSGVLRADYAAFPYRPGDDLGLSILYGAFGEHAKGHLAYSVAISIVICVLLAEILRITGFALVHAYTIGAIALVAPYASSVRLWSVLGAGVTGVAVVELAILVGLRGARRDTRSFSVHVVAAGLLVMAGMLTYEVAAVVVGVSVLLYVLVMPVRRALMLWGATLAGVGLATVESSRARRSIGATEQTSISLIPGNARRILGAIPDTVSHALFPLATPSGRFTMVTVAVVVAAGVVTAWRTPDPDRRRSLVRWLLLLALGALEALAGWAVFLVTSGAAYTPTDPGIGNRVNLVSSLGLAAGVYAVGAVVVEVVAGTTGGSRRVREGGAVVLGILLVAAYTRETRTQVATYQASYASELAIIGWFQQALPDPPADSSVFLYGAPLQVAAGVPVFGSTWELGGALQVLYSDPTITAVPVNPITDVRCDPDAILVNGGDIARWSYGRTYVADYRARRVTLLRDPDQCRSLTSRAPVSPWIG